MSALKTKARELRKSVEFEQAVRKYTRHLPTVHTSLKDLRVSRGDKVSLPKLMTELEETEAHLKVVTDLMESKEVAHLKELQRKRTFLMELLRLGKLEMAWRREVTKMEVAMDKADLDTAQDCLERLDGWYNEHWSTSDGGKKTSLEQQRQRLVSIIREM